MAISCGVGLFSGGTQRTALVMRQSMSVEAVIGTGLVAALGKAEFLERGVEQIAGIIAGERPAGAVGAAQPRCEADDQQPRVERAEGGDRRVEPVAARARASRCGRRRGADSADNRGRACRSGAPWRPSSGGYSSSNSSSTSTSARGAAGCAGGIAGCGAAPAARACPAARAPAVRTDRGRSCSAAR